MAGERSAMKLEGRELLVTFEGRVYAVPATCPHAGAPLANGELTGPFLRCPWHGATFDVRDGRRLRGPLCKSLESHVIVPPESE
jgi:nitrite reductase/ring-hydroxylating ferredoxin subunit